MVHPKRLQYPNQQRDDEHRGHDGEYAGGTDAEAPTLEFQVMFRHDADLH